MKRGAQFAVGLALAGLFVWLILRDLDRAALAEAGRLPKAGQCGVSRGG